MKQIELCFEIEKNFLPAQYNSLILSFIKSCTQKNIPEEYPEWFGDGETTRKSYTFSCFFPNPKFEKECILLGENYFRVFFSTCEMRDLLLFYNAFLASHGKTYPMSGNRMVLREIYMNNLPKIQSSPIVIKFDSALLVRFHDRDANRDEYLAFSDARFGAVLKENLAYTLQRSGYDFPLDDFEIMPVKAGKTVVSHFGMRVNANTGIFLLNGSPQLLEHLFLSGLGSAANSGHGKFRVIG